MLTVKLLPLIVVILVLVGQQEHLHSRARDPRLAPSGEALAGWLVAATAGNSGRVQAEKKARMQAALSPGRASNASAKYLLKERESALGSLQVVACRPWLVLLPYKPNRPAVLSSSRRIARSAQGAAQHSTA
jgi:hypothetical protein